MKIVASNALDSNDLKRFFELLKELRPHLTLVSFKKIFSEAQKSSSYQMIGIEDETGLVALMGYRILHDFVHGKHIYIDDLVSKEASRSKGYGTILLKHAEEIAKENGCTNLRLCTGIENEAGKKFYEKNNWNLRAVVYKKKM